MKRTTMKPNNRSEFVHKALRTIPCRFELCRIASRATRALHHKDRRPAETMNESLQMAEVLKGREA